MHDFVTDVLRLFHAGGYLCNRIAIFSNQPDNERANTGTFVVRARGVMYRVTIIVEPENATRTDAGR